MYTLEGKTRSTCHTLSTLDSHMVLDHTSPVVHVGYLSLVPTRMKHAPTPERSLGDRRQTGPAVILGHLITPPSRQPWSRGREVSAKWCHSYINLLGPYHQHVIGTFNTCSWGPTHRSLTDTGGGYSLQGVGFPHATPRPSQPMVLPFPPKGPTRSQI
jgi:hypothetical protein